LLHRLQDMTICYDERGGKYSLPKYVLSSPSNLARSGSRDSSKRTTSGAAELAAGGEVEMTR
jgi:hypothetical protein